MAYTALTDHENLFLGSICALYLILYVAYLIMFVVYARHVSKLVSSSNPQQTTKILISDPSYQP